MSVNYLTSVCVLSLGARVHGYDEPTDDHSSADATDPVPPSAPGPAAATAGSNATAGKHTHTHTHTHKGWTQSQAGMFGYVCFRRR